MAGSCQGVGSSSSLSRAAVARVGVAAGEMAAAGPVGVGDPGPDRRGGASVLDIRPLQWKDGWPVAGDPQRAEARLILTPAARDYVAEVRRALGLELDVTVGRDSDAAERHYRVYAESVRNLGTPVFPRRLFRQVLEVFGPAADILTISHKGRPLASVLSLYHRGVVMPYWGGGVAEARTWRANELMYYALMCHARQEKGCHSFDFGRSKVGTGPAAFKKNFGFTPEPLYYAKRALDGAVLRDINPLSPKYRAQIALWQKLPLSLANLVGPWIARGLG